MREIKFRAWSKESEVMFTNEILKNAANGMIKISKEALIKQGLNEAASNLQCGIFLPTEDKDLVFMQYTGIEDKNGKEICVGDIVVLSEIIYNNCSKSEIEGAKSCIGEIVNYKGLCMCVKYKDKNGDTLYRPLYLLEQDITSDDCSLAIIGNIYENEDLLEK